MDCWQRVYSEEAGGCTSLTVINQQKLTYISISLQSLAGQGNHAVAPQ